MPKSTRRHNGADYGDVTTAGSNTSDPAQLSSQWKQRLRGQKKKKSNEGAELIRTEEVRICPPAVHTARPLRLQFPFWPLFDMVCRWQVFLLTGPRGSQ